MSDQLYHYQDLLLLHGSNKALKLLRMRQMPLILSFLYQSFKETGQYSQPIDLMETSLTRYLERLEYYDEDEREISSYAEKAKMYLERWISEGYLNTIIEESTKKPHVLLSQYAEKAFQVIENLREREFVGAESRFQDLFHKLNDLIEKADPDRERRLEELQRQKREIDEQMRRLQVDDVVPTFEDYQVKSRYEDITRLAGELLGDFKEVEDNFRDITRRLYERQETEGLSKGGLLGATFDALTELQGTDQGRSFREFWKFMLDSHSQQQLKEQIEQMYVLLEQRGIEVPNRSLRQIKNLLYRAGRRVMEKNDMLADKLSREVVAKELQEKKKIRELIGSIRHLALRTDPDALKEETFLEIDELPRIHLPVERALADKPRESHYTSNPKVADNDLTELDGLARIYRDEAINKEELIRTIKHMLQHHDQITLARIVEEQPLTKGLAELLAYIGLSHSPKLKAITIREERDHILYDAERMKYLDTPRILFTR
ncbi:DUF3375 domain-containing protein [Roseivirga sp. BDSF3-8]|uniref:DUF3375 domain-containing protein n=1 Tax=Roseivirga sp. BDSF3-8 TaxID=3241598 RepID=UPI003531DF4C